MMEGTADVPHQIADVHLPEAASVFDAATALDTAMDMVDPQPPLVELLPQIEINLIVVLCSRCHTDQVMKGGKTKVHI
jgi:hypothetical protein